MEPKYHVRKISKITKIILSDVTTTYIYKKIYASFSPFKDNFNFAHEKNGFTNAINLTRCTCRFYKLLDAYVININSRKVFKIYPILSSLVILYDKKVCFVRLFLVAYVWKMLILV